MIELKCSSCSEILDCPDGTTRASCSSCLKGSLPGLNSQKKDAPLFKIVNITWETELKVVCEVDIEYAGPHSFFFELEPAVPLGQVEQNILSMIHKRASALSERAKITKPMIGFEGKR